MVGASLGATITTAKLFHNRQHPKPSSSSSTIKFLCSYGGMIVPRYPDGKLRYHGGETRVLAVDRFISFSELLLKMGELCGAAVNLRCQLPAEDLDALVSITSDQDLANLIEEYDRGAATPTGSLKIRAFLSPPKKTSSFSPPQSPSSSATSSKSLSSSSSSSSSSPSSSPSTSEVSGATPRCHRQISKPVAYPVKKIPVYGYHFLGSPTQICLVHNGNHWQ